MAKLRVVAAIDEFYVKLGLDALKEDRVLVAILQSLDMLAPSAAGDLEVAGA